jgi:hypothetical protein
VNEWSLSRRLIVVAAALVLALTLGLWVGDVITNSAALTAYATAVLALGTVLLAVGAIGTYVDQHRTIAEQRAQLAAVKKDAIAQILVDRASKPGEYLRVEVRNNSNRAIRRVYVWADIPASNRYHAAVFDSELRADGPKLVMSRRMHAFRISYDGKELLRSYRAILPGETQIFDQVKDAPPREAVLNVDDSYITAYALFADSDGVWWKCSEEGDLERLPQPPEQSHEITSSLGNDIAGLPDTTE